MNMLPAFPCSEMKSVLKAMVAAWPYKLKSKQFVLYFRFDKG